MATIVHPCSWNVPRILPFVAHYCKTRMLPFVFTVQTRLGGVMHHTVEIVGRNTDDVDVLHAMFVARLKDEGVSPQILTHYTAADLLPPGSIPKWPHSWTWKTPMMELPMLMKDHTKPRSQLDLRFAQTRSRLLNVPVRDQNALTKTQRQRKNEKISGLGT